jgi:hypothetical protein
MTAQLPLFATDTTAARLLDMQTPEFRRLVEAGALPGPCHLRRWDVAQLQSIMRGAAIKPKQELTL